MMNTLACETSLIEKVSSYLAQVSQKPFPDFDAFLQDVFLVAVERGLNDDEFTTLLTLIKKSEALKIVNKKKLLSNLVPAVVVPPQAMRDFMCWLISNYRKMNMKLTSHILQWIIGLVDSGLVDTNIIDGFYCDFYQMLDYSELIKYACILLCKFTKPHDVTGSTVRRVKAKVVGDSNEKFVMAVLSLFRGYKPRLVTEDFKAVDVNSVLKDVPHTTSLLQLRVRRQYTLIKGPSVIMTPNIINHPAPGGGHKLSSLIPFPTYSAEGLGQFVTRYPRSIEEALRKFRNVPIPQNVLSLLRDPVGLFIITHGGEHLQAKLSRILLCTLQDVVINQVVEATEDDKMYLLGQTYQLQEAMQQGVPCMSIFLAGFLLNWDGLGYRTLILDLVEWATFDSFTELSTNILRPLYMLFCTYNVFMRQQILRAVANLIKNMILTDMHRVSEGVPFPFLGRAPAWTSQPHQMLAPLVDWAEQLIKVGLCLAPDHGGFLLEAIHFYEMMNMLEEDSPVLMWTVVSRGVVYHSVLNMRPVQLNRVCRLLLRYHKQFLPKLRLNHPEFYSKCTDKINLTSKYVQELMNFLWIGQAMTRKEDGIFFKNIPDADLEAIKSQVINLDNNFDLAHNINFLPYILKERQNNGPQFCQKMEDFLILVDFYLEDIAEFIRHFSPSDPNPK